ncbi:UDP-N-acetylmuramoyl-tripeptide--D-alanyl-D-alanine ligase [Polaribacter aestuariivivens]|uniref:UDP-N-acetylmuramoyl-tripeptide--D-alanyl-D-alanine ligase n=1 Tax=Polaribacter aestuariivivens TaxID=2304626 RepID=A0A5S3N1J9_9FLAO|nr:UDP-N-acetylmuramoyl-tripeptide--D-alanyl-D-alanine ligase [Polaribacter aestuariivivens]TMM29135.1 UDP-N-acetylmuramoyl-tripeptide--D-alanyl-D-alanine ligase [Polaribacter aestuariivivens]
MTIADIYKIYTEHFLVDTDTRKIRPNTLFFALKGDNFNGNKFAKEAIKLGAKYAIIDEAEYKISGKTILVANVLETLQNLAKYHRSKLTIPVIGLTGSNGKTTTKELINAVLSKKYKTTATIGNLNNHIGVPLTILSITPKAEIGIIEMGANHQKEIEFLCSISTPDFGYITNFGKAHLEGFGGINGVIKGKSELYTYLINNDKTAIVNPYDAIQVEKTENCKKILFSSDTQFLEADPFVKISHQNIIIKSNLIGKYNYTNIAAAITIGTYFNISIENIKDAIENYIPTNNRSQVIKKDDNIIFLDAYNANPTSMEAALENFSLIKEKSKTVILGDMFELGIETDEEHQKIVNLSDKYSFDNTFYVGEHFFKASTTNKKFKNFEELKNYVIKNPLKNQSILIKGSRGMQLERVLEFIT